MISLRKALLDPCCQREYLSLVKFIHFNRKKRQRIFCPQKMRVTLPAWFARQKATWGVMTFEKDIEKKFFVNLIGE